MRKIDDMTIREFQVDVLMLMENAGRATAALAKRMLLGTASGRRVACLVGGGNNGGDGIVGARDLANWGAGVEGVVWGTKNKMKRVPLGELLNIEKKGKPHPSTNYYF